MLFGAKKSNNTAVVQRHTQQGVFVCVGVLLFPLMSFLPCVLNSLSVSVSFADDCRRVHAPLTAFPIPLHSRVVHFAQLAVKDKERMKNELAAAGLTKLPTKNRYG